MTPVHGFLNLSNYGLMRKSNAGLSGMDVVIILPALNGQKGQISIDRDHQKLEYAHHEHDWP